MLPIPGTSSVAHLEENVAAAALRLSDEELALLGRLVRSLTAHARSASVGRPQQRNDSWEGYV